jgi:DNA-binding response OmpR family regulator
VRILLVDRDADVLDALGAAVRLHWRGVAVAAARDGRRALELFDEHRPDVVVLDVSAPGAGGFGVLERIRRASDVPVLVTGGASETDHVRGLELGADQYVARPFSAPVLLARVRALARRSHAQAPARALPDVAAGPMSIDFERREVRLEGRPVELAPAEYRLLYHLARNGGRYLSHDALMDAVWRGKWGASANNLKALVNRLRAKIEPGHLGVRFIENQRGVGYRFVRPPTA